MNDITDKHEHLLDCDCHACALASRDYYRAAAAGNLITAPAHAPGAGNMVVDEYKIQDRSITAAQNYCRNLWGAARGRSDWANFHDAFRAGFLEASTQPPQQSAQPVAEFMKAADTSGKTCYVQVDEVDRTFTFPLYAAAQPAGDPTSEAKYVFLAVRNLRASHCKRDPRQSRLYSLLGVCRTQEEAKDVVKADEEAYHDEYPGYRLYSEDPMYEWEVEKHNLKPDSYVTGQPVEVQRQVTQAEDAVLRAAAMRSAKVVAKGRLEVQRVGLTSEQLRDIAREYKANTQHRLRDHWDEVVAFVRDVEMAHGIIQQPETNPYLKDVQKLDVVG